MEPLHLPNLEEKTLAIFDSLASQEKIFYEEAPSELITINGFDVSRAAFLQSRTVFVHIMTQTGLLTTPSVPIHHRRHTEQEAHPSRQCTK